MEIVAFSKARKNLKAVFDRVIEDADVTLVTRRNGENIVVLSEESYNSIRETMYLMQSPKNAERLLSAVNDVEAGAVEEHELIDA